MTEQAAGGRVRNGTKALTREERRAAALRANLARRKAKARGQAERERPDDDGSSLDVRPDLD